MCVCVCVCVKWFSLSSSLKTFIEPMFMVYFLTLSNSPLSVFSSLTHVLSFCFLFFFLFHFYFF